MPNFIAGQYTATYNAKALGQTAEGYRLSHQFFKQLVTGDLGAQTPQDAVFQGREQFVAFRLIEAISAGVAEMVSPYGGPLALGPIGSFDVQFNSPAEESLAKPLVLTAVAGTPAAAGGPVTITLPLAILAEGFPVEVLYGPVLREVPVRLRVYPNMTTGVFGVIT